VLFVSFVVNCFLSHIINWRNVQDNAAGCKRCRVKRASPAYSGSRSSFCSISFCSHRDTETESKLAMNGSSDAVLHQHLAEVIAAAWSTRAEARLPDAIGRRPCTSLSSYSGTCRAVAR
jgi:hypothetical protein